MIAPRRCDVTQLVKQFTLRGFSIFIFLVLPLDVFSDALFIQPYRADTVASRPQMLSLVSFSQLGMFVKEAQSQFSFQIPHELGHGILGWY